MLPHFVRCISKAFDLPLGNTYNFLPQPFGQRTLLPFIIYLSTKHLNNPKFLSYILPLDYAALTVSTHCVSIASPAPFTIAANIERANITPAAAALRIPASTIVPVPVPAGNVAE